MIWSTVLASQNRFFASTGGVTWPPRPLVVLQTIPIGWLVMMLRATLGLAPPMTASPSRRFATKVLPSIVSALSNQQEIPSISFFQNRLLRTVARVFPDA